MKNLQHNLLGNLGKLGVTAVAIATLGAVFLSINSPDKIASQGKILQSAEADVWDLNLVPTSKQQRFVQSLQDMGMSRPQTYDWNGNKMFFSYKKTPHSPKEVMNHFQEKFKQEGLNQMKWTGVPSREDMRGKFGTLEKSAKTRLKVAAGHIGSTDYFTGGIVPVRQSRNYLAMAGAETRSGAREWIDVVKDIEKYNQNPDEMVSAIRFIEAFRSEGDSYSTVTAIWSDEDFSYKRLEPGNPRAIDRDLPICHSCTPLNRIAGEGAESHLKSVTYGSPRPPAHLADEYTRTLAGQGWQRDLAFHIGDRMMQKQDLNSANRPVFRLFRRGNKTLTLQAFEEPNSTGSTVKAIIGR